LIKLDYRKQKHFSTAIAKLKEPGSLLSVADQERIAKFIKRFSKMIEYYFF